MLVSYSTSIGLVLDRQGNKVSGRLLSICKSAKSSSRQISGIKTIMGTGRLIIFQWYRQTLTNLQSREGKPNSRAKKLSSIYDQFPSELNALSLNHAFCPIFASHWPILRISYSIERRAKYDPGNVVFQQESDILK